MNRIHSLRAVGLTVLGLAWAGTSLGQSVTVIANPSATVGVAEVREIYSGDKQFAGATKLVPVDNAAAQDSFLAEYMKIDAAKYGAVWTKKAFRDGVTAPAVKSSDAEVIEFVKRTPGAVGYVKAAPAGGGVNVVK